jgi:hypothetical protein
MIFFIFFGLNGVYLMLNSTFRKISWQPYIPSTFRNTATSPFASSITVNPMAVQSKSCLPCVTRTGFPPAVTKKNPPTMTIMGVIATAIAKIKLMMPSMRSVNEHAVSGFSMHVAPAGHG